jgi:phosphoribosylformylglycinamidine synthase II
MKSILPRLQEVRVMAHAADGDPQGKNVLGDIHRLGITTITEVRTAKVYRLESLYPERADFLARALLCERITHDYLLNNRFDAGAKQVIEVGYKPGVMNPEAASLLKSAHDLGVATLHAADSSMEYYFFGEFTQDELERVVAELLVNKTVQMMIEQKPTTLVITGFRGKITTIPVRELDEPALVDLSKRRQLHLDLKEMLAIQHFFQELGRDPRDAELEAPAQGWSEHCGHKTTGKTTIIRDGTRKKPLFARLRETAELYFGDDVLSAFADNAGVARFYDGMAILAKAETHNSPSAISPYGGAATGSGGVFRDIMGTGQGASVLISGDIFCLAPPDLPLDELPPGCLHPSYLLPQVVAGVRDYGNRMGIPTNNGSLHFHRDFRAKPTVLVAAYGIMPESRVKKGEPQPGDMIVAIGGRTGRDGIHGATFSSGEMTAETMSVNAQAVQIGNAIEEKRMSDALIACRDQDFIRAMTDCGAGGFSSAVFEMGKETGVKVALENAPLKYPGLDPWEILLSESQERMVAAVAPENVEKFIAVCREDNVEAVVLGEFTDTKQAVVTYYGELLLDLPMSFLHDGVPLRESKAHWVKTVFPEPMIDHPRNETDWIERFKRVMGHLNVCSKEPIVRMYDHGVQGTSALPPFTGVSHDGPNDAVVIAPMKGKPYGLIVAHGMNPILTRIDPYWGTVASVIEAVANLVAVGGNFRQSWFLDNFIWPFPDEESLGSLDISFDALCDMMRLFKRPFISGKDSLSSTYRHGDLVIKIPPVICASIMGRIPDVGKTISSDFKRAGSLIFLASKPDFDAMGGSVYYDIHGITGNKVPNPDLRALPLTYDRLYWLIDQGKVLSAHDVSEGGIAAAVAEMCFGGDVGAALNLEALGTPRIRDDWKLFNETVGCLILEVPIDAAFEGHFSHFPFCREIGITTDKKAVEVYRNKGGNLLFSVSVPELKASWQQPMKGIFA